MKGEPPMLGFIKLDVQIFCAIPQSWSMKKRGKALRGELMPTFCDVSNQLKALEDGMNGIVYIDNRFVNTISARRQYTDAEEKVSVTASVLEPC